MQGLLRWFEQFWQPHEVVGDEAKGEDRLNLGKAAHFQLRQAADGFAPAEDFLDPFATNHADRITLAGRDVRRHSRLANLAQLAHPAIDGDVRLDLAVLQLFDEGLRIVGLCPRPMSPPRADPASARPPPRVPPYPSLLASFGCSRLRFKLLDDLQQQRHCRGTLGDGVFDQGDGQRLSIGGRDGLAVDRR